MPAISKIRFTNVIYENGAKRYNDDIFQFDGHNGVILIENGGGKTVFIQTAIQAVLPHSDLGTRKIKNTLMLENNVAHIAIEWILSEKPRRYALTCVTLFMNKGAVNSLKYVYEYEDNDDNSIDKIPFVKETFNGSKRASTKEEIGEYYSVMSKNKVTARVFNTIKEYHDYIENNFKIIPSEWRKIALINGAEGDVEKFFDACNTTNQLVDNLLIPTVEEALSGNGTKDFVDTFEKQREHFKKYKQLKFKIEESKRVKSEIDCYADVYKEYNDVNKDCIKVKENIKAIYKFIIDERKINLEKISENENQHNRLELEEKYLRQKKHSYQLQILNASREKAENDFLENKDKYYKLQSLKDEKDKRRKNLQVAKHKQNIVAQEQKIKMFKKQIKELDMNEDTAEVIEKLKDNSSELRGYYLNEEQKIEKEKLALENQLSNVDNDIKEFKNKLFESENIEKQLIRDTGSIDESIKLITEDINIIKNSILYNPSKEKIEDELIGWKNTLSELENLDFKYKKYKKSLEEEKNCLLDKIPISRNELQILKEEEIKLKEELKNIDENHSKLLNKIKEFKNSLYSVESLYLKQNTVINQLENTMEILRDEKEKLIFKERLAHRWIDDYSESEIYTADPLIEKWIKSWRNTFNYIASGTEYIIGITRDEKELKEINKKYPFWTISIITTDSEIDKLREKLQIKLDEISHPIIIMSETQVRDKVQGNIEFYKENVLIPDVWKKNINKDAFTIWKKDILAKAEEITNYRMDKEIEFGNCSELLKKVKEFYNICSYDNYQRKKTYIRELEVKVNLLLNDINNKELRIKDIDVQMDKILNKINEGNGKRNILEQKVLKSQEYLRKKKKLIEGKIKKTQIKNKLDQNKEELAKWEKEIDINTKIKEEIKHEIYQIKESLNILKSDNFYKEVLLFKPLYTEKSIEVLRQQRKILKDKLDKKQKGREQIEENIMNSQSVKESSQEELRNLREELGLDLDENIEFPIYGDKQIGDLIRESKELDKRLEKLKKEYEKTKQFFYQIKGKYILQQEKFYSEYKELVIFYIPLEQVKNALNKEENDIKEKNTYLINQNKDLKRDKEDIDKNIIELEKYGVKYCYLSQEIQDIDLDNNIKENLPYNRTKIVKEFLTEIDKYNEILIKKKLEVEDKKSKFIKFCDFEILDVKLKEIVVAGIKKKKTFKDILEWQDKMNERIMYTIVIAENDIREHDKEVHQFIDHLHSYLVSMVQELKQIPKKTKIKIGEQWKEVFLFNIPEWNEKEGKELLLQHVEWMQNQLEGKDFKDDNGIEVEKDVKNAIEKWLNSKQLLKIVMKSNDIKVKCRKVTNDQNMSSTPFSWEVSNSWSGGEKWSKNMTLFLGILNYLAEKRTQIVSNRKINRTVIVDNPFGKASSEHVLHPVFFIARQLGFQIIALTAHSEGKFITNYFPIVYSCKLRHAIQDNKQIMTKEKEIKNAYFRDNDPETLFRLGGIQQMKFI